MTLARQGGRVNAWSWTDDILNDLEASFSPERLSTYLTAAGGDRKRALQLYTWNPEMSAAFYGPLQGLEITLRNAIHQQLTQCYSAAWYDNPAVGLDLGGLERIAAAKAETARGGHAATPGRLVAALSFGFRVSLLGSGGRMDSDGRRANYEMTLWRPALRRAFPHRMPLTRKQAHRPLNALRQLRNRVAHHEPIFARPLLEDHPRILEVTGWISPAAQAWIKHHSCVPMVLDEASTTGRQAR